MSKHQKVVLRGTGSAATARKLIASANQPAPEVMRATVAYTGEPVKAMRAKKDFVYGNLTVHQGQTIYLVASKFAGRAYLLRYDANHYYCSSKDARVLAMLVGKVEAHRKAVKAVA